MVLDDLEASEAGKRSEEDVAKMFGFEDDYHQGLQIVAFKVKFKNSKNRHNDHLDESEAKDLVFL